MLSRTHEQKIYLVFVVVQMKLPAQATLLHWTPALVTCSYVSVMPCHLLCVIDR